MTVVVRTVKNFQTRLLRGGKSISSTFEEGGAMTSRSSQAIEVRCVDGEATDEEAQWLVKEHFRKVLPYDSYGNPISRVDLNDTEATGRVWRGEIAYSSGATLPRSFFEYAYVESRTTATETATRTHSLGTRIFAATGGRSVGQNGMINVDERGIAQGVQIPNPYQRFTVRARLKYSSANSTYLESIASQYYTTNASTFWRYPAGEVLFEGCDSQIGGVSDDGDFSNAYFDCRYSFSRRPSEATNIDGASFTRAPWEAVWSLLETTDTDGDAKRKTVCVYAETIYRSSDFSNLRLEELGVGDDV